MSIWKTLSLVLIRYLELISIRSVRRWVMMTQCLHREWIIAFAGWYACSSWESLCRSDERLWEGIQECHQEGSEWLWILQIISVLIVWLLTLSIHPTYSLYRMCKIFIYSIYLSSVSLVLSSVVYKFCNSEVCEGSFTHCQSAFGETVVNRERRTSRRCHTSFFHSTSLTAVVVLMCRCLHLLYQQPSKCSVCLFRSSLANCHRILGSKILLVEQTKTTTGPIPNPRDFWFLSRSFREGEKGQTALWPCSIAPHPSRFWTSFPGES